MNLLDHFVLQHLQLTMLNAELVQTGEESGTQEARVELNLTPRPMESDEPEALPSYQVSARLVCNGGRKGDQGPVFRTRVGFEAIYRQVHGEAVDLAEFTHNHASLTRQLYPLLQAEMRALLARLGLERIQLPFDLAAQVQSHEEPRVQVSGALH